MATCRLLIVLLAVAAAGFAPAPFPKKERKKNDPAAIFGTWEFVLREYNGVANASTARSDLEIEDGKLHFVFRDNKERTTYDLRLETAASPRGMEWKRGDTTCYVGSYRVAGDVLTMIFKGGRQYADRPTDFNGPNEFRFVLRRLRR